MYTRTCIHVFVCVQVGEIDFPYRADNMTLKEKLRHECEYYLHSLKRKSHEEEEEDSSTSDLDMVRIALDKLLVFPRIKALAERGVTDIRYNEITTAANTIIAQRVTKKNLASRVY